MIGRISSVSPFSTRIRIEIVVASSTTVECLVSRFERASLDLLSDFSVKCYPRRCKAILYLVFRWCWTPLRNLIDESNSKQPNCLMFVYIVFVCLIEMRLASVRDWLHNEGKLFGFDFLEVFEAHCWFWWFCQRVVWWHRPFESLASRWMAFIADKLVNKNFIIFLPYGSTRELT